MRLSLLARAAGQEYNGLVRVRGQTCAGALGLPERRLHRWDLTPLLLHRHCVEMPQAPWMVLRG